MKCGDSNAPRPVPPALKCVCKGLGPLCFHGRCQQRKARRRARKAASRGSSIGSAAAARRPRRTLRWTPGIQPGLETLMSLCFGTHVISDPFGIYLSLPPVSSCPHFKDSSFSAEAPKLSTSRPDIQPCGWHFHEQISPVNHLSHQAFHHE